MSGAAARIILAWTMVMQRRAWAVALVALIATAGAIELISARFAIDTSTDNMIAAEVPFRQNGLAFNRAFPLLTDPAVVVIDAPTPEAAEDAAERLAARLVTRPDLFLSIYNPAAEAYFRRNGLLFLTTAELAALGDRLAAAEPLLANLAADMSLRGLADTLDLALSDPSATDNEELAGFLTRIAGVSLTPGGLSWTESFGGEGRAATRAFLLIQPVLDNASLKPAVAAIAEIRAGAKALDISPEAGFRLRLTGPPVLDQEELDSVQLGGIASVAVAFLLDVVLLVIGLASWRLVVAVTVCLVVGLIGTTAFALVAIGPLNLLSVAFAVLFIGLAVDFGIHYVLRFREELERGVAPVQALAATAQGTAAGLALSALAAACGFFAFLPTEYLGLAQLGLISGVGMFIAVAVNLSLLPALLTLFGPRQVAPLRAYLAAPPLLRFRRAIIVLGGIGAALGFASLPFLTADFNPLNLKDPATESVATFLDLATDADTTPYTIDILAPPAQAAALTERLTGLLQVASVRQLSDFVPTQQTEKLVIIDDMALFLAPVIAANPGAATLDPIARRQAAERLFAALDRFGQGDGPAPAAARGLQAALRTLLSRPGEAPLAAFEHDIFAYLPRLIDGLRQALSAGPVTADDLPETLRARWVTPDGRLRLEVRPLDGTIDNAALLDFGRAVLAVAPNAVGAPITISEASQAVIGAFIEASLLAALLIVILLGARLRRLRDLLLVLTPLALAGLLTAVFAVVLGIALNFANLIALPLLLGLGVASGLHLVLRHREEAGDGARLMASSTPRAVLFSQLTTVSSFGSLALSGHPGMISMGVLLTIALGMTLLSTLVVLPALLARSKS